MLKLVGLIGKIAITFSFAIFLMFATLAFGIVTIIYVGLLKLLSTNKV